MSLENLEEKYRFIEERNLIRAEGSQLPQIRYNRDQNDEITEGLANHQEPDDRIQRFLNIVTRTLVQRLVTNGLLLTLTPLARRHDFYASRRNISTFIRALKNTEQPKVPLLEQGKDARYFLIVNWHEDRTVDIWNKDSNTSKLKDNPVQQISGDPIDLPTTYKISKRDGVISVGEVLLRDFGIHAESPLARKIRESLSSDGFTGPAFEFRGVLFTHTPDISFLDEYVKENFGLVPIIPAE
jgi:hypothetical protein